jgi:hypothetical protein
MVRDTRQVEILIKFSYQLHIEWIVNGMCGMRKYIKFISKLYEAMNIADCSLKAHSNVDWA